MDSLEWSEPAVAKLTQRPASWSCSEPSASRRGVRGGEQHGNRLGGIRWMTGHLDAPLTSLRPRTPPVTASVLASPSHRVRRGSHGRAVLVTRCPSWCGVAHEKQQDGHQQSDMSSDRLNREQRVTDPVDEREQPQNEPRQEAEYQSEQDRVRPPTDEAEPAAELVLRAAEQENGWPVPSIRCPSAPRHCGANPERLRLGPLADPGARPASSVWPGIPARTRGRSRAP